MAGAAVSEAGDRGVLALVQFLVHELGPQVELEDLDAVEPVLAVVAAHDDA